MFKVIIVKIKEIIDELNEYSIENRTNENKEVYIFEELNFEEYECGVIINEYDNNIFEVYLYIKGNEKAASKLLLKEFDNLEEAKNYYKELLILAKEGNLDKIKEKITLWFICD